MKPPIAVLLLVLCAQINTSAQSCNPYFSIREGVKSTYEFYNGKGKVTSRNINYFKDVTGSGSSLSATMVMDIIDVKKNEVISSGSSKWNCENGVVRFEISPMNVEGVDMSNGGIEASVDGDEMEIPSNLEPGQTLKDINYHVTMTMGGLKMMDRNFMVKNRKVESAENVTTTAGTFECIKITYTTESTGRGGNTTKPTQSGIWYAKDVGVVKSENYKDGKVTSSQLLVKLEQ